MKRTEEIQALRERFEGYDEDRCVLIYKEEAAALGVFDQAEDDGWIEWGGGECPVSDGTRVDVKHRDGSEYKNCQAWGHGEEDDCDVRSKAGYAYWIHAILSPKDIIAYRPHRED